VPKTLSAPLPEIASVVALLLAVTSRLPLPFTATVQVAPPPFSEAITSSTSSVVASTTVWVTVLVPSEIVIVSPLAIPRDCKVDAPVIEPTEPVATEASSGMGEP